MNVYGSVRGEKQCLVTFSTVYMHVRAGRVRGSGARSPSTGGVKVAHQQRPLRRRVAWSIAPFLGGAVTWGGESRGSSAGSARGCKQRLPQLAMAALNVALLQPGTRCFSA